MRTKILTSLMILSFSSAVYAADVTPRQLNKKAEVVADLLADQGGCLSKEQRLGISVKLDEVLEIAGGSVSSAPVSSSFDKVGFINTVREYLKSKYQVMDMNPGAYYLGAAQKLAKSENPKEAFEIFKMTIKEDCRSLDNKLRITDALAAALS